MDHQQRKSGEPSGSCTPDPSRRQLLTPIPQSFAGSVRKVDTLACAAVSAATWEQRAMVSVDHLRGAFSSILSAQSRRLT
jgi:hypothetical protein